MATVADWHTRALDTTGRVVAAIPADRWQARTPCPEWDVRGLVSHLVSGNLWAAELGAGGTIEGIGDRLDGDLLGADPAAAYAASAGAASDVFRRPGALDAPCAVSYGPVAGSVYAGHRLIDVLIHGWDLAMARTPGSMMNSSRPAARSRSRRSACCGLAARSARACRLRRTRAPRPGFLPCSAGEAERFVRPSFINERG